MSNYDGLIRDLKSAQVRRYRAGRSDDRDEILVNLSKAAAALVGHLVCDQGQILDMLSMLEEGERAELFRRMRQYFCLHCGKRFGFGALNDELHASECARREEP